MNNSSHEQLRLHFSPHFVQNRALADGCFLSPDCVSLNHWLPLELSVVPVVPHPSSQLILENGFVEVKQKCFKNNCKFNLRCTPHLLISTKVRSLSPTSRESTSHEWKHFFFLSSQSFWQIHWCWILKTDYKLDGIPAASKETAFHLDASPLASSVTIWFLDDSPVLFNEGLQYSRKQSRYYIYIPST